MQHLLLIFLFVLATPHASWAVTYVHRHDYNLSTQATVKALLRGPRNVNWKLSSGIIHNHLIAMVRHKQAKTRLQNNLNIDKFQLNFENNLFSQFSTACLSA